MSGVVQAILGVVEIVVGYAFGIAPLLELGVTTLLGYAASLLQNPHKPPLIPIGASYAGTLEPRRMICGTLRISGMYTAPPLTHGPNNDYLDIILTLAGHPVSGFGDIYFNQIRIASGDIGGINRTAADGQVANAITNNGYEGKAWIRRYDGTQTLADFIMFSQFTAWDANHIGKNLPYWAVSLLYDTNTFATGVPQISGIVQGAKLYDPRLDSTNGGSGSQRATDSTTWTYSTNAALFLRYYLTSKLGLGEDQTRIDDVLCAAAANICDQLVSVPIPVVPGLTVWTAGSNIVAGIGTSFLRDLNGGLFTQSGANFLPAPTGTAVWIKGPDNAMHQLASVQSDTQLTLASAFAGSSATDVVSQWNNSNATTTTQPRYTCNTLLDCTARFEDNISQIARAMMGVCVYSSGKWRMYAGAWSGAAFNLVESDLGGGVSVQCSTPRQNLYNAVRGNFINPARNYQPDEFPPIINATFAAADGETIYTETNFPCCTDVFEAQRNAIIVSRVGRNQKVITGQFGMSAYGIKIWETGTITLAELGMVQQSVRCIGWKFTPKGLIELQLQEAYSSDWTDPLATDYVVKGANTTGALDLYVPYPPTGLTATPVAGGIQFKVTLPQQALPGTRIQLFQGTAATPFTSASLIAEQAGTSIFIPEFDLVTRFYWVRTLSPQEKFSTPFPTGSGIPGVALSAATSLDPIGNLLNTNSWVIGTAGSQGNYIQYATGGQNIIILGNGLSVSQPLGPFGVTEAIWRSQYGTVTNAQSGFNDSADTSGVIDPSKTYRFSIWFRYTNRTGVPNIQVGGDDAGGSMCNLSPGTVDTNPYFIIGDVGNLTADTWYLIVGLIHGSGYAGGQTGISGVYDTATGDRVAAMPGFSNGASVSSGADFKWTPGTTVTTLRVIAKCTSGSSSGTFAFFTRPRFEMINGQEPSVRDLLTPGVVDPTFTPAQMPVHAARHGILPRGNVVPMVQNGTFTYTSTASSIQWSWSGYSVNRPDNSSFAMTAGSQNITGLSASTTYGSYAYSNESNPSAMLFATNATNGATGATGSPAIAWPPTATYAQFSSAQSASSLMSMIFQGKLSGATPASGSGGGGGGGGGFGCPHPDQLVMTSAGPKRASRLELGDELLTPDGWSPIVKLLRIPHHEWLTIEFDNRERVTVTRDHRFVAPDGDQVYAHQVGIGTIVRSQGPRHLSVVAIRLRPQEIDAVSIELADPHLYYLTERGPLSHNLKP